MSSGAGASMAHVSSECRRGGPSGAGASVAHVRSERRRHNSKQPSGLLGGSVVKTPAANAGGAGCGP